MPESASEVHVPVYGVVTWRPAGDTAAEWQTAADTPGTLTVHPGQVYQFTFHAVADVRDADMNQVLDAMAGVTAFKALELSGCEVSDRAIRRLAEFPWLESLVSCSLGDDGLKTLGTLTQLRELNLEGCTRITDGGLRHLTGLTRLRSLSLHHCGVSDAGVAHLAGLTALEEITLDGNRAITDRGVATLAAMPALHTIGLLGCWRMTDLGVAALAGMPKLKHLSLNRGSGFLGRLIRKMGIVPNTDESAFSQAAVDRLREAHPDCDVYQPIDWSKVPQ